MNKDYLPFYDSLKDDDKEFWLNCSKEELIDHIVSNIRNGEALLSRIDKAIEYIQDRYDGEVLTHTFDKDNVGELLEILKGRGGK
jgi:hypothetical protein